MNVMMKTIEYSLQVSPLAQLALNNIAHRVASERELDAYLDLLKGKQDAVLEELEMVGVLKELREVLK